MLLSIVVPVYKVEKYLKRCLDSIKNQIFTDFECILVDDGSPDNCPAICDEYVKTDSRFRVIHKLNEGVGFAIKTGVLEAKGKYIGFVDSDDWIESDMYVKMMQLIDEYKLDCCICNYKYVYENGHETESVDFGLKEGLYEKNHNMDKFYESLLPKLTDGRYIAGSRCNKVFNRNIIIEAIEKYNKKIYIAEDTTLIHTALLSCNKIYFINKDYYSYYKNSSSAMYLYKPEYYYDWINATSIYENYVDELGRSSIDNAKFYFLVANVVNFIIRSNFSIKEKVAQIKKIVKTDEVKSTLNNVSNSKMDRYHKIMYKVLKFRLILPYVIFRKIKDKK